MSAFTQQTSQYVEQIKSGVNSIMVAIRVRPLSQKQRRVSNFETIKVLQGKLLTLMQPDTASSVDILRKNRSKQIQYAFDFVFDKQVTTKNIFDENVSILMDGLMQGYNASVLAYGATSCGKTYTMVGENQRSAGLMAMAVMELLNRANQAKKYQQIKLKASYMEIYNENIKDLLISQDKNLEIREDPKQGISIPGLTQVLIDNISQLKTVLKVGSRNRTKQSTGCNEVSSRSHGVFQIHIQVRQKAQSTVDETIVSKLLMIDLAGSERATNTTNKGLRMVQGAKINQSLLVLGNCIKALSEASEKGLKNAFVPYRGSKLTRLLKDSLGGNCRTVMIAHVAPAANLFQQTYNTLVYAHRAKNIKNNPIRNTLIAETHLSNYVNVINNLKKENQQLKYQMRQKQLNSVNKNKSIYASILDGFGSLPILHSQAYNQQITKLQQIIAKHFQQQDSISQKITELQMKIDEIALNIYELQLYKNQQKVVGEKNDEMAQLTKDKLLLQQQLEMKQCERGKIIKQINKNQIIGSSGQSILHNSIKEKKVQCALKLLKYKQEVLKHEKKQMDIFAKKMKNSMKSRDQIIQKQKILIKKNNIKSRITYSQLDFKNDESLEFSKAFSTQQAQKSLGRKTIIEITNKSTKKQEKTQQSPKINKYKLNLENYKHKSTQHNNDGKQSNLSVLIDRNYSKAYLKKTASQRRLIENDSSLQISKKSKKEYKDEIKDITDKINLISQQLNGRSISKNAIKYASNINKQRSSAGINKAYKQIISKQMKKSKSKPQYLQLQKKDVNKSKSGKNKLKFDFVYLSH